jgi:transcriptional regulator with XRE-family HTH domain
MPAQSRLIDVATERSRDLLRQIGRELREARLDRNLSLRDVCAAVGISVSLGSRIERGLVRRVPFELLARLSAAVGLEAALRLYPAGSPIRDAVHAALLKRLRERIHPSLRFRTEIPMPIRGDKRAWDAGIEGSTWWVPIEAETKPRDFQALDRRIALKQRDGEVDHVLLLLLDSRHNRAFVEHNRAALTERYPVPGERALELLAAGAHPGGAMIFL